MSEDDVLFTREKTSRRCQIRQGPRVRTRVKVCLHTPLFAAARCNLNLRDLQPVSAWRISLHVVWPDF